MQMSQTPARFLRNCRSAKEFHFGAEPSDLGALIALGPRSVDSCTGAHNLENADIVGPSGMAMMAVVTNCCEFTA
jgi:hypothetical protein